MAFIAVSPGPSVFPPRERYQSPPAMNFQAGGQDNSAMMLAVLQMLMQSKQSDRETALSERLAESNIATQDLQRTLATTGETERRRSEARMRADQAQQARRKEVMTKFERSQEDFERKIIQERFSGSQNFQLGKELFNTARGYSRGAVTRDDLKNQLSKLPTKFQSEFNKAGSDPVKFGMASRLQSELANLKMAVGSDAELNDLIDGTIESLSPALVPYAMDEGGLHRYLGKARQERERIFTDELDARAQAVQDEASRLTEIKDLTAEDFQRKLREGVTTAYSGLALPENVYPRLDLDPGEVRPVTIPGTPGLGTQIGTGVSGMGRGIKEFFMGRSPVSSGVEGSLEPIRVSIPQMPVDNLFQTITQPSVLDKDQAVRAFQEQAGLSQPTQKYDTTLAPEEEQQFQVWKSLMAPQDSGEDYDLRGAFKAGAAPDQTGHWPDTFKKPNHPTFSKESIYSKGIPAGTWVNGQYVPPVEIQDVPTEEDQRTLVERLFGPQ